ncbi:MAG: hypothetical protein ACREVG_09775 [Burkholderiales bacterium]
MRCGPSELVARVPPGPLPEPGATLPLRFAPEKLHFFEADPPGRRIRHG